MKFLLLDTDYLDYISDFYQKNPGMSEAPYTEQEKAFSESAFGIKYHYAKHLRALGHEVMTVTPNNEKLQKQWAKEHGVTFKEKSFFKNKEWRNKILIEQARHFKPDVCFSLVLELKDNSLMNAMKKHSGLLVGQIAAKLPEPKYFKPYDLILSSLPNIVEYIGSFGIKSEFLKLAFEPSILEKLTKTDEEYDVTHVGGYSAIHNPRNEILEYVADKTRLDTWGYATENLRPDSPILKNYHGEAWGLEMFNIIYNSKMTITGHVPKVAKNFANNMSLYEATGCGCLLMTDMKDNLGEIFEVGKEVVAYTSAEDLLEKINYYLENDEEREAIAKAGQERTLKDHNYFVRTQEMLAIIEKYL